MAENRIAEQAEIADGIENLMANEFVLKAQAFGVENPILADNHGIFQGAATGQAIGFEIFHLLQKAKGPGRGDVPLKSSREHLTVRCCREMQG